MTMTPGLAYLDLNFDKIKNLLISPSIFYRRIAYRDAPGNKFSTFPQQ